MTILTLKKEADTVDWKTRIKEMRQRAGMTQQKFANHLGFAMSTIFKWENGDMVPGWMSQEKLIAFEEALNKRERETVNR